MTEPSEEEMDTSLSEIDDLLRERFSVAGEVPITTAQVMEFVRNAYFRGYEDGLLVNPKEDK
jgi:hypothetical protein